MRRRDMLGGALAVSALAGPGPVVDTHIHLFSEDRELFPYHRNAVYQPGPAPLHTYVEFARKAGVARAVIVHPEPYQDDHRYLEYCFLREPAPLFFKGTCLFDPIDAATPERMALLAAKNPGRIVGLRIHCNRERGVAPTVAGPIRDRDLRDPRVRTTIRKAHELKMAVQCHIIPVHAREVAALAVEFARTTFVLDHLARSAAGTPAEFADVLAMGRLKNVVMKFSGVAYSSREPHPYRDVRALVRQTYDAFGPERMIWGSLGHSEAEYKQQGEVFAELLGFAPEAEQAQIRGGNALRLFWG